MDLFYVALVVALFGLTFGLVRLARSLEGIVR